MAADAAGNLFITDSFSIRKLSPDIAITTVAGNNTQGFSGDGGPATSAQLSYLSTVVVDGAGNLFNPGFAQQPCPQGICGWNHHDDCGKWQRGLLRRWRRATSAQLDGPSSVAVDNAGNVFIGDGRRIRKVSSNGIITTWAGNGSMFGGYSGDGGPATSANGVSGPLAVDGVGNLFIAVADRYIRKISPAGIITTLAGTSGTAYFGDGGPAPEAELSFTTGSVIAADAAGNVYVAESTNNAIRILRPMSKEK